VASVFLILKWVCHTAHPLFSVERKESAQSAHPLLLPPNSVEHKGGFFMFQVLLVREVDEVCASLLCGGKEGAIVIRDMLVVGYSSMIAPLALQAANRSFVRPLTPRKLVPVKERTSSVLRNVTLLRLASVRSARLRLAKANSAE
jgi:hypothetical protein